MKKTLLLIFLVFLFTSKIVTAQNQEANTITVEGYLTDYRGNPAENVWIYVYYNNQHKESFNTKSNGHYKVNVQPGSIIYYYWNSICYSVTINSPVTKVTVTPYLDKNTEKTTPEKNIGHAEMTNIGYDSKIQKINNTISIWGLPIDAVEYYNNGHSSNYNYFNSNINNIYFDKKSKEYLIETDRFYLKKFSIDYNSSFAVNLPNKLPVLQKTYSQGINSVYDISSKYSFGSNVNTLSASEIYNPYDFFDTGYSLKNSFRFSTKLANRDFIFSYKNDYIFGIVPNTNKSNNNYNFAINNNNVRIGIIDFSSFLSDNRIIFPENGANYSRLVQSVMTTPVNFNNNNTNYSAYYPDAKNPYKIVNDSYDYNKYRQFGGSLKFYTRDYSGLDMYNLFAFDRTIDEKNSGYSNYPIDEYLKRESSQNHFFFNTSLSFHASSYYRKRTSRYRDTQLNSKLTYVFNYNDSKNNLNSYINSWNIENKRNTNELIFNNEFNYEFLKKTFLMLETNASTYSSNTLNSQKIYFSPSGLIGLNYRIFTLYTRYSEIVTEYPIHIQNLYFNTLLYNSSNFDSFKEIYYPTISENILPETAKRLDFGFKTDYYGNRYDLNLNVNYKISKHKNSIFPVLESNFILKNVADYTEQNLEIKVSNEFSIKSSKFYIDLIFNKPRTEVTQIYSNIDRIPYAGFSDISLNLIEGQAIGAIVGSSFLKDSEGNKIISSYGFPLVDYQMSVIGDPTPDWILNLNSGITIRNLSLNVNLEYKKGGDVWNGTKNVQNYYGTSQESADLRDQTEYVFEGVTQNSEINTKPVIVDQYFWQMYGYSGVAEAAIEDATWFRLKEISLKYKITKIRNFEVSLSVWAQNLLLFTPYSGVDPQTALFGYQTTQAIDLFNIPALKSYGTSLSIRF
ncbi:MAG: hypothetical protein JXL97_04995 [Bacteroidales bacterium]|nr:hypothetical protein [Bacteroidales bacterium]